MAKDAYDAIRRREEDELISRVVGRMAGGQKSLTTPETAKRWARERSDARKALKQRMREAKTNEDHARLSARLEAITTPADRKAETPLAIRAIEMTPTAVGRDIMRLVTHGIAHTGSTVLKTLDIPNRIFGGSRSLLQDMYEEIDRNTAQGSYELFPNGAAKVGETAVSLATAGEAFGSALPAVLGTNVGVDTYETAKATGASTKEALGKGITHGIVDTAIWTLGQGLSSQHLPKAWQWLGREITGALRGAASSVTSDTMYNSLGADITPGEMAKRAAHAAWMVPLLGMLKMGGKRRQEAEALIRKARPELAGAKTGEIIDMVEKEFLDPKSQKIAVMWVARKGANLPDDVAQIKQALEVASKVKGLDPMSKSPFEILSDPTYARYLPKPKPQDVKAFSNMKRYPMGVIGFDVSDDTAGRQATREMINAYMSPSSNPWCLATGKDAAKLGELGPAAEGYWKGHSAVPKQIFFQEVDGKLELTAFRATSPGGEWRQEYWDTSDAGYSGIPLKVKVPGDPMGRYRKMVFRPDNQTTREQAAIRRDLAQTTYPENPTTEQLQEFLPFNIRGLPAERVAREFPTAFDEARQNYAEFRRGLLQAPERALSASGEVQGTFEDIAPGEVFKGDPFRDGRTQTWVKQPPKQDSAVGEPDWEIDLRERLVPAHDHGRLREVAADPNAPYVLVEDKIRTTENGITKFRTTRYANPTDWDYEPPKPGEAPKPVEIEESELVSPEWMRARGYDPESESDVRKMQQELEIQTWGNGMEAAMAVVPTKRTFIDAKTGATETTEYGPNGQDITAQELTKDGVPYRYEYFQSGPAEADPSPLYHTLDVDSMPLPRGGMRGHTGFRLIRNPGTDAQDILDEIKWDEGLDSFVRTSGNRRWRVGYTQLSELPEGLRLFNAYKDADQVNRDFRGRLDVSRDAMDRFAASARSAWNSWDFWARANGYDSSRLYKPEDFPSVTYKGIGLITEDRQSDGTWAPTPGIAPRPVQVTSARDRRVSEYAGTHGGDIPNWATITDGELEDWALPPPPEVIQIPAELVEPVLDPGDDIPFALKAGHTRKTIRADEAGGDVAPDADPAVSDKPPVEEREPSPGPSAPARIIINPKVFKDKRDGLCVAYNEAFRVIMEMNGFDPQAEPTEEQRKFFSDTAYADDERMLRRTILARICTFDDSVKNPTDEQLDEALEFLETVMEIGAPQSEEEQANVQRIHDMIAEIRKAPRPEEQPAEQPVESEAPPVAAVYGGSTRELRREQREQEVLDQYMARTAGRDFMADVGDGLRTEVGVEPSTEVSGEISRRAEEDNDEEEENNMLPRADIGGGKTGVPKGSAKTDDTYVTNTAVVMPEAEARKMGVVTQGFEHVGKDQVAIPFEDFRSNGTVVDAAELLAESYGSKEAAEAAVAKSMANRAKRYPGGVPSEAAMADPESVPVVPAGARPGPWDEAYLSHAARAGHWNLKTVKSGAYLRTAGYIPGLSLGLIPTRVLGTSSPSIEVRRMLNSQVGETGESAGNGRIVTISDTANPNKPGWYASDEGYRAAALGSVKGWLTANERMPGEGEDLAAVMAAAHRDRAGLKRGKIDKNGKDFLAAVAKAYEAERGGSASKKDKEILAAARDMDMWEQVVGARRYDRYSTTV